MRLRKLREFSSEIILAGAMMATYYGLSSDEPDQKSERLVATALRALPDGWVVFHHVNWQSIRSGRQGDGEADFIIMNPTVGVLVIEVKGGGIDIENGRWRSKDRYGRVHEIKNPYEQALSSKYTLVSWLNELGLSSRAQVGHAVAFPNVDEVPNLGLSGPGQITWTRSDLRNISLAVQNTVKHWALRANLSQDDMKKLIGLLAPTISVRRKLISASTDAELELLRLTAEQVEAFSGLKASRGGLVLGGAGTGKTVLAIARSQQLAQGGFRTLLVCYNDLLGRALEKQISGTDGVFACTFHSLCFRESAKAKLQLPSSPGIEWWDTEAPTYLVDACAINGTQFDAVVVDEGQDFSPIWIDTLRCITTAREGRSVLPIR